MCENNALHPLIDLVWESCEIIYRKITQKEIKNFIPYKLKTTSKESIYVYIGCGIKGDIYLNLKDNPNTFIVGTTGSGKSVCTKSIITSLINNYNPNQLELVLCDLKRVELNLFRNLQHTKKFVYRIEDVIETIQEVLEECENRYDLFMKRNVTNIFEYNKLDCKKLKFQILFIEEIVLLLQDTKKEGMKYLKQLLSICRACGIYVFISTQRPSADIIDSVVKANINNRIVFKVEDEKNSIICLDSEGAELLQGKGHGIIKIGSYKEEFRGYYISDDECKKLIETYIIKEELKTTSKQIGFIENKYGSPTQLLKSENQIEDLSFLDKL